MKYMSGEEVARLINIFSTSLGIQSHLVKAVMRERASVSNVATRILQVIYSQLIDVRCFSHTWNLIGEKMKIPSLNTFASLWISLFFFPIAPSQKLFGNNKQEGVCTHTVKQDGGVNGDI